VGGPFRSLYRRQNPIRVYLIEEALIKGGPGWLSVGSASGMDGMGCELGSKGSLSG
jgi:hypothetical protein